MKIKAGVIIGVFLCSALLSSLRFLLHQSLLGSILSNGFLIVAIMNLVRLYLWTSRRLRLAVSKSPPCKTKAVPKNGRFH